MKNVNICHFYAQAKAINVLTGLGGLTHLWIFGGPTLLLNHRFVLRQSQTFSEVGVSITIEYKF